MALKDQIIELLENNKGTYLSGQCLAEKLGVSRAAVWKSIHSLCQIGYPIDAVNNKGYCLSDKADILSRPGIEKYLQQSAISWDIHVKDQVSSTNHLVKKLSEDNASEGYVLFADSQSTGKGRNGKAFFSPADTGIYLSMLLYPKDYSSADAVKLTTMAAAAMCDSIATVCGAAPKIKWLNDIFVNNRKICGILTEGDLSLESNRLERVVLGLGLNMYPPKDGFPDSIKSTAGPLLNHPLNDGKNHLAACFLNRFSFYYTACSANLLLEQYRKYFMLTNQEITFQFHGDKLTGIVTGIDAQYRLVVRLKNQQTGYYAPGDIQLTSY